MVAKIKRSRNKSYRHYRPKGVSHKDFQKVYWPYIPIVLVIATLLTLNFQTGTISSFFRHPGAKVLSYATTMSINGLLADTNASRSQNGVASLSLNDQLIAAAQAKANDMASRNYWSHDTPEGNPPWVFVNSQNYSYQKLGENLAAGFSDEQAAINGWMASPPHRENLLDGTFTQVGFGFANNSDYTSAGGGPMTIVVAFYGEPQVLAQQTNAPINNQPVAAAPTPTPSAQSASSANIAEKPHSPTSTNPVLKSAEFSAKSSRAQLALASLPIASIGTSLAIIGGVVAIGLWLSRHALAIRRAFARSESFAIHHPLMDIGLLVIAALSFLLSQTAGLIQ